MFCTANSGCHHHNKKLAFCPSLSRISHTFHNALKISIQLTNRANHVWLRNEFMHHWMVYKTKQWQKIHACALLWQMAKRILLWPGKWALYFHCGLLRCSIIKSLLKILGATVKFLGAMVTGYLGFLELCCSINLGSWGPVQTYLAHCTVPDFIFILGTSASFSYRNPKFSPV